MGATQVGKLFLIMIFLSACGGGSINDSDLVYKTGPNISLLFAEISVTIDSTGDVALSGSVTPTLIGIQNLGGIGWEFGFEKTLYDAQNQSDLLFILYQNGDGEIIQHQYDVRQPFEVTFSDTDWVRRMKREDNGSMVVFVERRIALQTNPEIDQNDGFSPATQFVRDYYNTISRGDYESAWNMLTDNFKTNRNKEGYGPYSDWWRTVDRVEVISVNVTNQNSQRASMYVELRYYFKNGNVDTYDLMSFTVIYSPTRNDWMIDDAYLISGTK
jgi:hypothetical protein